MLTAYAGVIGGKRALMLHYMPSSDVREGDRVVKEGHDWRVQPVIGAQSYTFTASALIVSIV
jgi:hypothetical protein